MPKTSEMQARIDLLVGIDKATYQKSRTALASLFDKRTNLALDDNAIRQMAGQFRDIARMGGAEIGGAISKQFDADVSDAIGKFEKIRARISKALEDDDAQKYEELAEEQVQIQAQLSNAMDAYKKSVEEANKSIQEGMKKEEEAAKMREEAAKKLRGMAVFGSLDNMKDAGEGVADRFTDALNKASESDLSGFVQSILGSMGKLAQRGAETKQLAADSAADAMTAKDLAASAAKLGRAAALLGIAAGAIGGLVAAVAALDGAAKELNQSMLEGASIADFSAQSQITSLRDVEGTMEAARKASHEMALEFRGTSEEMAGILAELNQAGFSYREMEQGVSTVIDKQAKYAEAVKKTFEWSRALGVSTSEIADTTAEWSTSFGLGVTGISEGFKEIADFAMDSGFNVKRFFTAVSQATSGMALYNMRIEEAAFFLSKTQKILGETDAADFFESLTKGFMDESITDRIKRIMIAGAGDTERIFRDTADRTAKGFVSAFSGSDTQDKIKAAFKSVNMEIDLSDPQVLQNTWGKMDDRNRRLIIAELRANGDEQSQAAARQLETLGRVVDGAKGGMDAQVRGLGALDMQGKLAYKLQTLGDRRLNEMSMEELAAFESYAGISGAQLEQLTRVEEQLYADYELAKKNGKAEGQSFKEFISSNEMAQEQLKTVADIVEVSEYFAQQTVESTRSVFSVLKNTIAQTLDNIYSLLTSWFGVSREMGADEVTKLTSAITAIGDDRKASAARLDEIDAKIAGADQVLATKGKGSAEHSAALGEKAALEARRKAELGTQELLRAMENEVRLMDKSAVNQSADLTVSARSRLSASGADMEILSKYLSPEQVQSAMQKISAQQASYQSAVKDRERAMMFGSASTLHQTDFQQVATPDGDIIADMLHETATGADVLAKEQIKLQEEQNDILWKTLSPTALQHAFASGQLQADSEKLASSLGIEQGTKEFKQFVADAMMRNFAPHQQRINDAGAGQYVKDKFGFDMARLADPTMAQDFVMRPGQAAQRFSPSDTILGMKGGGPLVTGQQGLGGVVNVTINGGSQAEVYNTVKSALKSAGLRT